MNKIIDQVTADLKARSKASRDQYVALMQRTMEKDPPRRKLSCGNLAHGYAACSETDKQTIKLMQSANLGIITSYNDMLSAHQPLEAYPEKIKQIARGFGSSAQVAGGVPAMCDGVTQGQAGMELSLFSRDVIAMATAIGLSHNLFDGVLCLGVCDKIVPGMLIGALQFGHLPVGFIPAGPMPSGLPNKEKAAVRQRYAAGKASRDELLAAESASYHSAGTCTFYGTANSNQVIVEMLGVQLPGTSFFAPDSDLRDAAIGATVKAVINSSVESGSYKPMYRVVTPESVVNALVALLATGGSTNHSLHLIAIARAAGIDLTWQDFDAVSKVTPLLARVYPNGEADVNAFQAAGGMPFLVNQLRTESLLNENVTHLLGGGLDSYVKQPELDDRDGLKWQQATAESALPQVLTTVNQPFDAEGGLRLLSGNLGDGVIKVSAVAPEHRVVEAPCVIFHEQDQLKAAFENGELDRDVVVVVRFQGASANGMPELHKLTPYLGILQDKGYAVALVTDGRMSGASGKVPAAIHISPEASLGGALAKLRDGDVVRVDANTGELNVVLSETALAERETIACTQPNDTLGRNLFTQMRGSVAAANLGAAVFNFEFSGTVND